MIIKVGNVIIGSSSYIPIQTMIKLPLEESSKIIDRIENLKNIGCDIVRVAFPDESLLKYLKEIVNNSSLPIVADIHFDYRLAIMAVESGVKKVRINPGNIGNEDKVKQVIQCVKEHNVPVRIGINAGSLPKHLLDKYNGDKIKVMIESAKEELGFFEKYGFDKVVLSFKTSNVIDTIKVNEIAKTIFPFPLHIGVTEAGDIIDGTVKNSVALAVLLSKGIGDTIRVSLTSREEDEVVVAKRILESLGKRDIDIEIISCPTCSRTEVSIESIVKELKQKINMIKLKKKVKIAVMGCIVNGPGEAKDADFGVACGKGQSILFRSGEKIKIVKNNVILDELLILLKDYYEK